MNSFIFDGILKKFRFVLVGLVFCLLIFSQAHAGNCNQNFSWLPNTEPNIAGYKIYYGQTNNGPYPNVVNIGNPSPVDGRITGTVTGLECGQVYYFVCVAVTDTGTESPHSNQARTIPAQAVPGIPEGVNVFESKI